MNRTKELEAALAYASDDYTPAQFIGLDNINRGYVARTALSIISAEVRRLERDKARLDWLDAVNANMNAQSGSSYGWEYDINHIRARFVNTGMPALTIRDAIDAAMKEGK